MTDRNGNASEPYAMARPVDVEKPPRRQTVDVEIVETIRHVFRFKTEGSNLDECYAEAREKARETCGKLTADQRGNPDKPIRYSQGVIHDGFYLGRMYKHDDRLERGETE